MCDRVNDRFQIFKQDGTFVKEVPFMTSTRGDGSVWEIAFSRDPKQKYLVPVRWRERENLHVFDREST